MRTSDPSGARRSRTAGLARPATDSISSARRVAAVALALAGVGGLLAAAAPRTTVPHSPTVEEVLAKSTAARGGAQKLHAVRTRREIGTLELGAGNRWPFVVEHKRPSRLRMEIDLQGNKLIRGFDGEQGWQKQPQAPAPEKLRDDDQHNIANEADFDTPLVDTGVKGKAELQGKETVGGHDAYKVRVTLLSGAVYDYDVDSTSYLPIHWQGARVINGKPVVFESDFSDYRDAGGVKYAFVTESWMQGSKQKQRIAFNQIEINPPIDDARFTPASIPAPAPAPAAPGSPPPASPPAKPPLASPPPAAPHPEKPPAATQTAPPPAGPPPGGSPTSAFEPAPPPGASNGAEAANHPKAVARTASQRAPMSGSLLRPIMQHHQVTAWDG
jgi:hypothetical protein